MKARNKNVSDLPLSAVGAKEAAGLQGSCKTGCETEMRPVPSFLEQHALLRLPQVLKVIPVGKSAWWNGIREGRYPPGVKLSPRVTVWPSHEIQSIISASIAARDQALAGKAEARRA
ncbi:MULTISPECIES: helix-turn-helix transcriptional regulator [unclassified Variovorax]|uniref:helix-turn-helix transcriptional regulator n=1 Tax=unclassified Variovorax TaxID=663243 RepID=UPI0032E7BE66